MRTRTTRPRRHRRLTAICAAAILAITAVPAAASTPERGSGPWVRSVAPIGSIHLTKQVRGETPDAFREGDTVPYEFLVTNGDGEELSDIQVHDPLIGTDPVCTIFSLAPAGDLGSSASCEGELTVTAADVAAGELRNVATVTAQSVGGPVQDIDEVTVPVVGSGAVTLRVTTTISDGGDGEADPGDTVTFTYDVANTGNTPLTEVGVVETLVGPVTCSPDTIAPGGTATCAADHIITEQDVETGQITGTATAHATVPAGADPVIPIQHTHVTPIGTSTLSLVLTGTTTIEGAPEGDPADVGDHITSTFTLENIGIDPFTAPHVTGLSDEAIGCEADVLEPGDSTICVATDTHEVTEADLVAGSVTVLARGVATTPLGLTVTGPEHTIQTTTRTAQAGLDLVIEVNRTTRAEAPLEVGDQLRTSALVTSTGTVSVTEMAVEAELGGEVRCDADVLAPGGSTQCVAVEPYVVTVEDVLAGELVVTKTATALAPTGVAAVIPVTTSVTVVTDPERVEPEPEPGDPGTPGDPATPGDDSGLGGSPAADGPGGSGDAGTGSGSTDTGSDGSGVSDASSGSGGTLATTGSQTLALLALALLVIGIGIAALRARRQQPQH